MNLETLASGELISTLLALSMLLISAYLLGSLFEKLKAPRVVGEITGGILWSTLYFLNIFPDEIGRVFLAYAAEGKVLNIFYQLGLIFLMFLSGYNTRMDVDRRNAKTVGLIFFGATVLPMAAAVPFVPLFQEAFIGPARNTVSFVLVFLIGVSITSIPVISKIFFDMGIMNTRFSNTVLTVSTFQDLCLWILLNAATRIAVSGQVRLSEMLLTVGITLGLFLVIKLVSDHLHTSVGSCRTLDFNSICFAALLCFCALLSVAGVNLMYSAFLIGYIVKAISEKSEEARARIAHLGDFVFSFFVPIYFALVGIQLDLIHAFSPLRFLLFFLLAFGLEAAGTLAALCFSDLNFRTKINFGITMNARGGPGIVLATVAYDAKIINIEFFTVLILTTMLSSAIAGYWLRYQQKKDAGIFENLTKTSV